MATMAEAVQAALVGPERKKLKIYDHEFNIKPAEPEKKNNRLVVNGQISHHLGWGRPDDQVYYIITIEDGAITDIKSDITRGGTAGLAGPVGSAIGAYFGVAIPPDKITSIGRELGRAYDGSWEKAAEIIIANIATAFQQKELQVPGSGPFEVKEGLLVKGSDNAIYLIEAGERRWIPDDQTFNCRKLDWNAIQAISDAQLSSIRRGPDLPSRVNGTLLKGSGPAVFMMENCERRWITSQEVFNSMGLDSGAIQTIPDNELDAIPRGVDLA